MSQTTAGNINDLFTAINDGIDFYRTLTGDNNRKFAEFDDENIQDAVDAIDDRAADTLSNISSIFNQTQNAYGVPTGDAIQDYYTRFDDVIRDQFARGTDKLENFNPDLSPQTGKLTSNIDAARNQYGLQYSPALDLYNRVTTVDPANIYSALNFGVDGYNINNPITKYDDAYSQSMINFGENQLRQFTDAFVNPSGPGQQLMNYGV